MKKINQLKKEIEELCKKLSWDYKDYLDEDLNPEEMDEVECDMKKAKLQTLQEVCKKIEKVWAKKYGSDIDNKEFYAIDKFKEELLKKFQGEEK